MPRMSSAEYAAFLARRMPPDQAGGSGVPLESPLHEDILDECQHRGWIAYHGMMSERTHRTLGEPDFIIVADRGRVFQIEAKSKTGKRSPKQLANAAMADHLGHTIHVVRSIAEFMDVIKQSEQP